MVESWCKRLKANMTKCVQWFVHYSLFFPVSFTFLPPFFFKDSQGIRNQELEGKSSRPAPQLAKDTEALMGTGGGPGQTPEFHSQGEFSIPQHTKTRKREK